VLYPASAVKVSAENMGEVVQEVRKAFGTVGDYSHGTLLNNVNMTQPVCPVKDTGAIADLQFPVAGGGLKKSFVFGYDFEGFAKTATESGLNISDRALNVSLQLRGLPVGDTTTRLDTYAMCDCLIYIGIDGSVSSRI
jgi:hypothetical protein